MSMRICIWPIASEMMALHSEPTVTSVIIGTPPLPPACFSCSLQGALKEVKRALLDADVNLKVTIDLVEAVKNKAVGMKLVDGEQDTTVQVRQPNIVSICFFRFF